MARLLVLANRELALEFPDGTLSGDDLARRKERHLLRLLERMVAADPRLCGSVEAVEFEAFTYPDGTGEEANSYYYNKTEKAEKA